jgi:ribosomal protein S18 acetylase RimI-like enzyme
VRPGFAARPLTRALNRTSIPVNAGERPPATVVEDRAPRRWLLEWGAVEPLDNMMWHAMNGPQRNLAEGGELAKRYPSDVGPFCAVPDEPTGEHFDALRTLVGPGNVATILRGELRPPEDWEVLGTIDAVQMIGPSELVNGADDARIATLGVDDVEEMMSLTSRTKPGPFARRTWELGTYLGIRVDGRLVSMAGQRARTNEHVEISAVCTDEAFVGRGLGRALILAQVNAVIKEGKLPMLHAAANNGRAISLYEFLGFHLRRPIGGVIVRAPLDVP